MFSHLKCKYTAHTHSGKSDTETIYFWRWQNKIVATACITAKFSLYYLSWCFFTAAFSYIMPSLSLSQSQRSYSKRGIMYHCHNDRYITFISQPPCKIMKKSVSALAAVCMNEPQFSVSLILTLNHFKPKPLETWNLPQCSKPVNPQWFSATVTHWTSSEFPLKSKLKYVRFYVQVLYINKGKWQINEYMKNGQHNILTVFCYSWVFWCLMQGWECWLWNLNWEVIC